MFKGTIVESGLGLISWWSNSTAEMNSSTEYTENVESIENTHIESSSEAEQKIDPQDEGEFVGADNQSTDSDSE